MDSKKEENARAAEQELGVLTDEELEAYYHVDPEELAAMEKKEAKADFVSSFFFLAVSLYTLIKGLRMPVDVFTGDSDAWYAAPGAFPIFIGGVLILLSIRLCWESAKKVGKLENSDFTAFSELIRSHYTARLLLAIGLLVVYIFVLLGRVNFSIATFLYLFVNMILFRKKGFAIWKLAIICAVAVAAITYGFGTLASIPLP